MSTVPLWRIFTLQKGFQEMVQSFITGADGLCVCLAVDYGGLGLGSIGQFVTLMAVVIYIYSYVAYGLFHNIFLNGLDEAGEAAEGKIVGFRTFQQSLLTMFQV